MSDLFAFETLDDILCLLRLWYAHFCLECSNKMMYVEVLTVVCLTTGLLPILHRKFLSGYRGATVI